MFGCIGRRIMNSSASCNHQKQRRSIAYVSDCLFFHPIETALIAVSTSMVVAVPLVFQNRSLVQSFEDMQQKYRDVRTSERQLKDEQHQLRDIRIRGRSGETILQQVLEEAKGDHFIKDFHLQTKTEDGKIPDSIVEFYNGAQLVVDSKAPEPPNELFRSDSSSSSCTTNGNTLRKQYVRKLKNHVKALSQKRYPTSIHDSIVSNTVMMLPGEGYLQAAYNADGEDDMNLLVYAVKNNVFVVGPNGLRTILQLLASQQVERAQALLMKDAGVQEAVENRIQPIWKSEVFPQLKRWTNTLNKYVKETNTLIANIKAFDDELRGTSVLNIDQAKKSELPKEVNQPDHFL